MLGKNIKYYRLKKNMSIRELASEINVSPMTVSNYVRDARKQGMDMIKALAKALDIRVSDFLEDHGNSLPRGRRNQCESQTAEAGIRHL